MSITIDKEFESLIPPLSPEEFQQLEENCVKEGIRDALITWNGILVDGHNRFKIAAKHGLHWNEKRMEFADRDSAKAWIIRNQLGRRNLKEWDRFDLTKSLEEIEKRKAKERMSDGAKGTPMLAEAKGETRDKMASLIGVSHGTYDKMKAIDDSNDERLKQQVRNYKGLKMKSSSKNKTGMTLSQTSNQGQSNTCDTFPLREGCIERRGICRDYILYMERVERIRNQIEQLNENQAPPAVRTVPADKGGVQEAGDRRGKVYQSPAERLQAKAGADPEAETEAQGGAKAEENARSGQEGGTSESEVLDRGKNREGDRDV